MEITISRSDAAKAIEALADRGDLDVRFLNATSIGSPWRIGRDLLIEADDEEGKEILAVLEEQDVPYDVEMPEPPKGS